jgi:hypothetical protein
VRRDRDGIDPAEPRHRQNERLRAALLAGAEKESRRRAAWDVPVFALLLVALRL